MMVGVGSSTERAVAMVSSGTAGRSAGEGATHQSQPGQTVGEGGDFAYSGCDTITGGMSGSTA